MARTYRTRIVIFTPLLASMLASECLTENICNVKEFRIEGSSKAHLR